MQQLHITGIESKQTTTGNTKTVLICEEGKFYFYRKTKTGVSKAQEQFNKYDFKIGDVVEAEVQTEQKTFTNPAGNEITYSDNWVKFFGEVENTPVVQRYTPSQASNSATTGGFIAKGDNLPTREELNAVIARIDKMAEWAKGIEKRLSGLETLEQAKNPEAVEFHQSFPEKKFDFGKAKEILTDPSNSGVKIEMPENL